MSLHRAGDLDSASLLARHSVYLRTRPTVFTCNAVVAALYRAGRHHDAVANFHFFFDQSGVVPNLVSFNFLLAALCDSGRVDEALHVYRARVLAPDSPLSPSNYTYDHLTRALVAASRAPEALDLLREMLGRGLGADSGVFNNVISGFLALGDLEKANELFDELRERCLVYDGVVNATFMDHFFSHGRPKEAMESYRSLLDRQFKMIPPTCNALLRVLLKHGRSKEAWELFDSMLDNHAPPTVQGVNSDSFIIMVNRCFEEGRFDEAVATFRRVGTKPRSRAFSMDVPAYNNMILRFVEHGMVPEAEGFFAELQSKMLNPDVTGYKTLIEVYFKEGRVGDALGLYHRMVDANLRVLPEWANRWFAELIERGRAEDCVGVLAKMGERDPLPDAGTYEIVARGVCAAGALDKVVEVVDQAVRYGVGVTPALRGFVLGVFDKEGRRGEIERVMDERRMGYGLFQPRPPQRSGPPSWAREPGQPSGSPAGYNPRPAGPTGFSGPGGYPGPTGYAGKAQNSEFPGPYENRGYIGPAYPISETAS